jgi:hypothetical protein
LCLLRIGERNGFEVRRSEGRMQLWRARMVISAMCLLCFGCLGTLASDPMGRKYSLENAQRRYTEAIRWGQFEQAAAFVVPEVQEEFHSFADALLHIRITDYEVGRIILDEEKKNATVHVTYRGYRDGAFVEKPLQEIQEWIRESGNDWRVRPQMASLVDPFRPKLRAGDVPASR